MLSRSYWNSFQAENGRWMIKSKSNFSNMITVVPSQIVCCCWCFFSSPCFALSKTTLKQIVMSKKLRIKFEDLLLYPTIYGKCLVCMIFCSVARVKSFQFTGANNIRCVKLTETSEVTSEIVRNSNFKCTHSHVRIRSRGTFRRVNNFCNGTKKGKKKEKYKHEDKLHQRKTLLAYSRASIQNILNGVREQKNSKWNA